MPTMATALDVEAVEDALLMRIWIDVEAGEGDRPIADAPLRVLVERPAESSLVAGGVVLLEVGVFPVDLKGRAHPVDQVRHLRLRETHVPLETIEQRRVGQIRRADE